jgi:transposase
MTKPYGIELRRRVVTAIDDGMSARAAAVRFSVASFSAIKWHQLGVPSAVSPSKNDRLATGFITRRTRGAPGGVA